MEGNNGKEGMSNLKDLRNILPTHTEVTWVVVDNANNAWFWREGADSEKLPPRHRVTITVMEKPNGEGIENTVYEQTSTWSWLTETWKLLRHGKPVVKSRIHPFGEEKEW